MAAGGEKKSVRVLAKAKRAPFVFVFLLSCVKQVVKKNLLATFKGERFSQ